MNNTFLEITYYEKNEEGRTKEGKGSIQGTIEGRPRGLSDRFEVRAHLGSSSYISITTPPEFIMIW
jgi:hypothetical protein